MVGDEALNICEPQVKKALRLKVRKRTIKRALRLYFSTVCILFFLIVVSCCLNFMLYSSYVDATNRFDSMNKKAGVLVSDNRNLSIAISKLKKENETLAVENKKIREENEEILKLLSDIKKQNTELINKNAQLEEDNIALQNSLKMAASVGIKPQNYTKFEGITSRGELKRGEYLGKFLGTAYTPSKSECGNDRGITNSGKPIIPGVSLAVDGKYWPFGTVFYIKGLGYAVAMDTGSAIKGKNRFDFAVFDKKFALTLGSKYWDVYLVKMGNGKVEDLKF